MTSHTAHYVTEASSHLAIARRVGQHERPQLAETITLSGWYALSTPTTDGMTHVEIAWRDGQARAVTLCKMLRPLTEEELDTLAGLDGEDRSDFLDGIAETFEEDRQASLEVALEHLGARHYDRLGLAVYFAAETHAWYLISDEDLIALGNALREDPRDPMAYSEWCSGSDAEEIDLDAVIRDSEITESTDLVALATAAGAAGDTVTWIACDHLADEIRRRLRDAA